MVNLVIPAAKSWSNNTALPPPKEKKEGEEKLVSKLSPVSRKRGEAAINPKKTPRFIITGVEGGGGGKGGGEN